MWVAARQEHSSVWSSLCQVFAVFFSFPSQSCSLIFLLNVLTFRIWALSGSHKKKKHKAAVIQGSFSIAASQMEKYSRAGFLLASFLRKHKYLEYKKAAYHVDSACMGQQRGAQAGGRKHSVRYLWEVCESRVSVGCGV